MDDEDIEIVDAATLPRKHNKWTFAVLTINLMSDISQAVTDYLDASVTILSQHRLHKIEEENFYEAVVDGYSG